MKRSIKSLIGFTLRATDGEIGKVKECFFDDDTWTIRYLIVDTGNWLTGRVVLIATEALFTPDWKNKIFPTSLSRDQVMKSPNINTKIPVSRQEEKKLYTYYSWTAYWANTSEGTIEMRPPRLGFPVNNNKQHLKEDDIHLRSTDEITDYNIKAIDGDIGDVEDFMIEVSNWKIKFIIIDTGKWFPGKKVLLPPKKIKTINWNTGNLVINSTIKKVKNGPVYNPKDEFTEVYSIVH